MQAGQGTLLSMRRTVLHVLVRAGLVSGLGFSPVQATTITVDNSTGGHVNYACSIVDAVSAVNNGVAPFGSTCLPGDGNNDTIVFAPAITSITFATQAGNATSALLLSKPLTIDGGAVPNSGVPRVTIQRSQEYGTDSFRLIEADATATLKGLTLSNGETDGSGGGVFSKSGALTIVDSVVTGNRVIGGCGGGGIYASTLQVAHSTISYNNAYSVRYYGDVDSCPNRYGGGIRGVDVTLVSTVLMYNWVSGSSSGRGGGVAATNSATITNSTISGNSLSSGSSVARGGGIYTRNLSVSATTISNNYVDGGSAYPPYAIGGGGGIWAKPTTASSTCTNSTVSGNRVFGDLAAGGGIAIYAPGTAFEFCTIADNWVSAYSSGAGAFFYASPPQSFNLQGALIYGNHGGNDLDGKASTFFFGDHNLIGTTGYNVHLPVDTLYCDPMLLPLADNGGPTMTHALGIGSCAKDAGPTVVLGSIPTDQRGPGHPRKVGNAADIGAYEAPPDRIFASGFDA